MLISHTYLSRIVGRRGHQCPDKKDDVSDEIAQSILGVAGNHQQLVDVSRCHRLTPRMFEIFTRCEALLYLDLSYTKVADLSFLRACPALRAFNGAGLKLTNDTGYDALRDLPNLELLILRSSNLSNGSRLKEAFLLRSLDVSYTRIDSLDFLKDMGRLEELVIESLSLFTRGNAVNNYLKTLQGACVPPTQRIAYASHATDGGPCPPSRRLAEPAATQRARDGAGAGKVRVELAGDPPGRVRGDDAPGAVVLRGRRGQRREERRGVSRRGTGAHLMHIPT